MTFKNNKYLLPYTVAGGQELGTDSSVAQVWGLSWGCSAEAARAVSSEVFTGAWGSASQMMHSVSPHCACYKTQAVTESALTNSFTFPPSKPFGSLFTKSKCKLVFLCCFLRGSGRGSAVTETVRKGARTEHGKLSSLPHAVSVPLFVSTIVKYNQILTTFLKGFLLLFVSRGNVIRES